MSAQAHSLAWADSILKWLVVSNAILYWNTIKVNDIVENLRSQGAEIDKETLSHISLLPFKHVVPNGTYFIEDV
jgi:diketogulonate reductase-like aldo/keto reductase